MRNAADPAAAPFDPDRHIDAMAPLLGLTITEAQRPGVAGFLAVARQMAALVATAPVDDASLELAATFRPGEPHGAGAATGRTAGTTTMEPGA